MGHIVVLLFIFFRSLHSVSHGDYTDVQSTGSLHCFHFLTLLPELASCYDGYKVVFHCNIGLHFSGN